MLIMVIILFFKYGKAYYFIAFQSIFLIYMVVFLLKMPLLNNKKRLIVFNVPETGVILISSGRTGILADIPDTESRQTDYYLKDSPGFYSLKKVYRITGIMQAADSLMSSEIIRQSFYFRHGFFKIGSKTGYILNSAEENTGKNDHVDINLDYLIFSGRKWWILERRLSHFHPRTLILDSTVPSYTVGKIRQICPEQKIYSVSNRGPFIWED